MLPYWSVSVKSKAGMTSACSGEEEEGAGDEDGACAPGSSDGPDCSGAACEDEVEAALAAPGVIKNRSKARCAVTNARAFLAVAEEWGSFARYLWHWVDGVPVDHRLERPEDMPAEDDLSRRVSADLKKRGFRFVGPVIVYSYLQGAGLINDHLVTCPWHGEGL